MDSRAAIARAYWARLAYTTLFERIIDTSVSATASYGALMRVTGAGGTVTISAPNLVSPPSNPKMAFDFGVVSDGAFPVIVSAPDGKTINGQASITLAASPGASVLVFLDLTAGNYVGILGGGGSAGVWPPSYTARGPIAPQTLTGTPTAVGQSSITTAAFSASQKAIITYSVELDATAGTQDNVTLSIFDGVAGSPIDTYHQTVGNSAVDVLPGQSTVSWTLEVNGLGTARTFGLAVSSSGVNTTIPISGCRGVVRVVNA